MSWYRGYRIAEVDGERTSRHLITPFEQTLTVALGTHRFVVEVSFSWGVNALGRAEYAALVPITATLQPSNHVPLGRRPLRWTESRSLA